MVTALFVGMWGTNTWRSSIETLEYRNDLEKQLSFNRFKIIMILLYGRGVMAIHLVNKEGKEPKVGDIVQDFRGDMWTYKGCIEPKHPESSGRVLVSDRYRPMEYYPGVFDMRWEEVGE